MRLKKSLCLVISLVLLMGMMAGCGKKEKSCQL